MRSDNNLELSKGQKRVREIIDQFLPEYKRNNTDNVALKKLYDTVINRFIQDPDIKSDDLITNRKIGYEDTSPSYLQWLARMNNSSTVLQGEFPPVLLNRCVIDIRPNQFKKSFYYCLSRQDTVVSCLFALAQGISINSKDANANYYVQAGILQVGSGGAHRLIAHVLYGNDNLSCEKLELIEGEHVDPVLDKALLMLDRIFGRIHEGKTSVIGFREYSQEEVEAAKGLAFDTTDDEKDILQKYVPLYLSLKNENRSSFTWVWARVIELRNMRNTTKVVKKVWQRFWPKPEKQRSLSAFEKWYMTNTNVGN